jgi:haloalkane dehalogenase
VVFVHGNPTWSYLWRRLVPPLLELGRRVVMVDHVGFGASAKPRSPGAYSIASHAERFARLMEALDLGDATLVVHDWGGPVALPWAVRNQARVGRLLVLNTFAPPLPGPMGHRALAHALRLPAVGEFLVQSRAVVTERFLLPAVSDEEDRAAYRAPHLDPASRAGVLAFPRQVPLLPADRELADHLPRAGWPAALVWGLRDPVFGPSTLARWRELLPGAEVTALERCGQFVPEQAHEELLDALLRLEGRSCAPWPGTGGSAGSV